MRNWLLGSSKPSKPETPSQQHGLRPATLAYERTLDADDDARFAAIPSPETLTWDGAAKWMADIASNVVVLSSGHNVPSGLFLNALLGDTWEEEACQPSEMSSLSSLSPSPPRMPPQPPPDFPYTPDEEFYRGSYEPSLAAGEPLDQPPFLLPQELRMHGIFRIRYAAVPSLMVKYPSKTQLQSLLWRVQKLAGDMSSVSAEEATELGRAYQGLVRRSSHRACSPAEIPIPAEIAPLLGTCHLYSGTGTDSALDRQYVSRRLHQLLSCFGIFLNDVILYVPCKLLHQHVQLTVAQASTLVLQSKVSPNTPNPQSIVGSRLRSSDLVLSLVRAQEGVTPSLHQLLTTSAFTAQLVRQPAPRLCLVPIVEQVSSDSELSLPSLNSSWTLQLEELLNAAIQSRNSFDDALPVVPAQHLTPKVCKVIPTKPSLFITSSQTPSGMPLPERLKTQASTNIHKVLGVIRNVNIIKSAESLHRFIPRSASSSSSSSSTSSSSSPSSRRTPISERFPFTSRCSSPPPPPPSSPPPLDSTGGFASRVDAINLYIQSWRSELEEHLQQVDETLYRRGSNCAERSQHKWPSFRAATFPNQQSSNKLFEAVKMGHTEFLARRLLPYLCQPYLDELPRFLQTIIVDPVPDQMQSLLRQSAKLHDDLLAIVNRSPSSPRHVQAVRLIDVSLRMTERAIRTRLVLVCQEISQDVEAIVREACATSIEDLILKKASVLKSQIDLQQLIYVSLTEVPRTAATRISEKFKYLLSRSIQQLDLLQREISQSLSNISSISTHAFTPGLHDSGDCGRLPPLCLDPRPPRYQIPEDTVAAFVQLDMRRDQLLFSDQIWNRLRFGSEGSQKNANFRQLLTKSQLEVDSEMTGRSVDLFRALATQVYGTDAAHPISRVLVLNHVLSQISTYQAALRGQDLQEYVAAVSRDEHPGDSVLLQSLANLYGHSILVFSPAFPRPVLVRSASQSAEALVSGHLSVYCLAYLSRQHWVPLSPKAPPIPVQVDVIHLTDDVTSPGSACSRKKRSISELHELSDSDDSHLLFACSSSSDRSLSPSPNVSRRSVSASPNERRSAPPLTPKKQRQRGNFEQGCTLGGGPLSLVELASFAVADCISELELMQRPVSLCTHLLQRMISQYIRCNMLSDRLLAFLVPESVPELQFADAGMQLSDSTLRLLSNRCGALRALSLANCTTITSDGISSLVRGCPNLQFLDLRGCIKIDDLSISEIASHANQLTTLNLSGCTCITNKSIRRLSQLCPSIRHLSLKHCPQITDPVVDDLVNNFEALDLTECAISDHSLTQIACKSADCLQSLKLNGRTLTDVGISQVAEHCHNIRDLEIHGCNALSDEQLLEIGSRCGQLLRLDLTNCRSVSSAGFRNFYQLEYLDLTSCFRVTDAGLQTLAQNCPQLTFLNLASCDAITDHGLTCIVEACVQIEALTVSNCAQISDLSVRAISRSLLGLRSLNLHGCRRLTDTAIQALLRNCKWLQALDISWCEQLTDACLRGVSLPYIIYLNLEELSHLTASGIEGLGAGGFPELRTLKIGFSQANDATIDQLSRGCTQLTELDLTACNTITPLALTAVFSRWRSLRRLSLRRYAHLIDQAFGNPVLEVLNLSFLPDLKDECLLQIGHGCPNLQEIDLAYCTSLTPQGLHAFIKLLWNQLKIINLRGCRSLGPIALKLLAAHGINVRT